MGVATLVRKIYKFIQDVSPLLKQNGYICKGGNFTECFLPPLSIGLLRRKFFPFRIDQFQKGHDILESKQEVTKKKTKKNIVFVNMVEKCSIYPYSLREVQVLKWIWTLEQLHFSSESNLPLKHCNTG